MGFFLFVSRQDLFEQVFLFHNFSRIWWKCIFAIAIKGHYKKNETFDITPIAYFTHKTIFDAKRTQ